MFNVEVLSAVDAEGRTVVELKGELSQCTGAEFVRVTEDLSQQEGRQVVLDFAEVTLVDSSGIGKIVGLARALKAARGRLWIRGLNKGLKAMFDRLGLLGSKLDLIFCLS